MKKTSSRPMDRRSFIQVTTLAGGGVIIGLQLPVHAQQPQGGRGGAQSAWSLAPNTYITVHPDNTFTIVAKNPETGQGIRTALPMILKFFGSLYAALIVATSGIGIEAMREDSDA